MANRRTTALLLLLALAPSAWAQFTLSGISTTMNVMSTLQGIQGMAHRNAVSQAQNRLALRGHQPGVDATGPIASGDIALLLDDNATAHPFTELPNPELTFDPTTGLKPETEDPFGPQQENPDLFDPAEVFELGADDHFNENPAQVEVESDPTKALELGEEDPFNEEPLPLGESDPAKGLELGVEDPFAAPAEEPTEETPNTPATPEPNPEPIPEP